MILMFMVLPFRKHELVPVGPDSRRTNIIFKNVKLRSNI